MKIDDLMVWEAFHELALKGSFTKAAHSLKISIPQLSKRIAKLEEQLGMRLFARSTRNVALTDEGKSLLPRVTAVIEDLKNLESTFDDKKELSGTIRITSVPFVAHRLLLPALTEFMKKHPKIHIDLDLSEGMVNLIESNFDLAIRIHHEPEDSTLIYKKLVPNDLIFCCSPKYLKNAPAIKKLTDLQNHNILMLDIHKKCRFKNHSEKLGDVVNPPKLKCNNGWFLTEMALKGEGLLVRSVWDVQGYLDKGQLVQVLKNHPLEPFGNIYAVVPNRKFLAPRVRMFLEFLGDIQNAIFHI